MELLFRPFKPEDMDGLYFLDQRCHDEPRRTPYGKFLDTLLEKDVAAVVTLEAGADAGEEAGLGMIAALIVRSNPWKSRLEVLYLAVHPELRRAGIARRLVGWAEKFGRGAGFRELAIAEECDSAETAAVMAALGFDRAEEVAPAFRTGRDAGLWVCGLPAGDEP